MFQFPGFASHTYGFSARYRISGGFPHSDIFGSKFARNSPKLFAACHVLHRLSAPRHPPNALMTLDRRHSVQGQAAPHNGLLLAVILPRLAQTTSSAIQTSAFLILFTLSNNSLSFPRTSFTIASTQHPLCSLKQMVEPTGIEPVTSSLQS
jgi:hypothetical protein